MKVLCLCVLLFPAFNWVGHRPEVLSWQETQVVRHVCAIAVQQDARPEERCASPHSPPMPLR